MKYLAAIFFVLGIGFFLLPSLIPSAAQAKSPCPSGFENLCKITIQENPTFFGTILQVLLIVAVVFSLVFLVIGGIRWIMSEGDKAKVEKARSTIMAAIIGLIISFLAYFIVTLVASLLVGDLDLKNLKIPRLID